MTRQAEWGLAPALGRYWSRTAYSDASGSLATQFGGCSDRMRYHVVDRHQSVGIDDIPVRVAGNVESAGHHLAAPHSKENIRSLRISPCETENRTPPHNPKNPELNHKAVVRWTRASEIPQLYLSPVADNLQPTQNHVCRQNPLYISRDRLSCRVSLVWWPHGQK